MGKYKLFYDKNYDMIALVISIMMIAMGAGIISTRGGVLLGFLALVLGFVMAYLFYKKYTKNEDMDSITVDKNGMVIHYTTGRQESYARDDIKNVAIIIARGVTYITIGVKDKEGRTIRPYSADVERLYNEFSTYQGWGELPLF